MIRKAHGIANAETDNAMQQLPMAPLRADYQAVLDAPIESVFDAFADDERFCQLIPGICRITVRRTQQGQFRRCDFGNDLIVEQHIVKCEPPCLFAYVVTMPNPLGVRQHYSVVTCEVQERGTCLRWKHYFDHDDVAAMLDMLDSMFEHILAGLVSQ